MNELFVHLLQSACELWFRKRIVRRIIELNLNIISSFTGETKRPFKSSINAIESYLIEQEIDR